MNKIKGKTLSIKTEQIVNTVPTANRAKGIRLPHGNPTIVAMSDVAFTKMPTALREVFKYLQSHKNVQLNDLKKVKSLGAPRHIQWKVRILVKREEVRAVAEKKEEVSRKNIAKAA